MSARGITARFAVVQYGALWVTAFLFFGRAPTLAAHVVTLGLVFAVAIGSGLYVARRTVRR